jgi:cytochrome c-type biogenesis protein CcsB
VAELSDTLLFAAVVVYALAMLGFAGDAGSRRARRQAVEAVAAGDRAPALVGGPDLGTQPPATPPVRLATPSRGVAGTLALWLTVAGALVHTGSVVTRGLAAGRVPWGNMYEFSSAVALTAVLVFLALLTSGRVERSVGAFVMVPVVLYLGLAGTVLYTEAGPLVPALNSYWIKIHVIAAVISSGAFLLSGVVALLFLLRHRFDTTTALLAADPRATRRSLLGGTRPVRLAFPVTLGRSLPPAPTLDRSAYAVIAFAFPIWTFAIIAGAIWAEGAWGRYWGWDPKETWSFITWVLYAGYLHARSTAGWKGAKAAWIAVAAAVALVVDYYVVNIFVVGLHSYA